MTDGGYAQLDEGAISRAIFDAFEQSFDTLLKLDISLDPSAHRELQLVASQGARRMVAAERRSPEDLQAVLRDAGRLAGAVLEVPGVQKQRVVRDRDVREALRRLLCPWWPFC